MAIAELLDAVDRLLRPARTATVTGRLSDWRLHPRGNVSATLLDDAPAKGRLRLIAERHAALAAAAELADAGRTPDRAGRVTVHGQLSIDARWGLQLRMFRLLCVDGPDVVDARRTSAQPDLTNRSRAWPRRIGLIGLIAPDGGDDAHADVAAVCEPLGIILVEHRVPVTGGRAARSIGQALDRLALDPRPDVTLVVRGGGPSADFAPFDSAVVAAAIARHPRPVITGLGHAADHTAADTAAHTSCITPTAAAQRAAASRRPLSAAANAPHADTTQS